MTRTLLVLAAALIACRSKSTVEHRASDAPTVTFVLADRGLSMSELENAAIAVEHALAQAEGIARIETRVTVAEATIRVVLDARSDTLDASGRLFEEVTRIQRQLPPGMQPVMIRNDVDRGAVMRIVVRADALPLTAVSEQARALANTLERVAGVARVDVCGERARGQQMRIDGQRLDGDGQTVLDVIHYLEREPRLTDVSQTPPFLLRDMSVVNDLALEPRCRAGTAQGEALLLTVRPQRGAEPLEVRSALEQDLLRHPLPSTVHVEVLARDRPVELAVERVSDVVALVRALAPVAGVRDVVAESPADPESTTRLYLVVDSSADPDDVESAARQVLGSGYVVHARDELTVQVVGPDLAADKQVCDALAQRLGARVFQRLGGEETTVTMIVPDRAVAAKLGVALSDIDTVVAATRAPGYEIVTPGADGNIYVLDEVPPLGMRVRSADGSLVPLSTLAQQKVVSEPREILRDNQQRWVGLRTSASEREVREAMSALSLPAGMTIRLYR
jgi:multidrug efflux pump subunit AcrB